MKLTVLRIAGCIGGLKFAESSRGFGNPWQ